jgi:hypothetical protein
MHKYILASAVLLSLCLGCGTGEYQSHIGQSRGGAAGGDLLGPAEDMAGTRVSIRAPRCVTLLPQGTDPKRAKTIPIPLPGIQQRTYEGFVEDTDGGKTPFYFHVMTMEVPKAPGMNFMDQMKAGMSKVPGAAAPQFTEFQATGPDGKECKWQTARKSDKDDFYYKGKDGKDSLRSMPDVEEMYMREDAGYLIMIAWRIPANIEQNVGGVGLAELAKAAAGGVSVKPQ